MQNKLLAAKAALPDYDRSKLVPRIVHLGFGAFHRAHQGVYADIWRPSTTVTGDIAKLT